MDDCNIQTRVCTKCKRELPANIENFYAAKSKSGWESRCRDCKNEFSRKHYSVNREKILSKQKVYNAKNSAKQVAKAKKWAEENPERVKATKQRYVERNIEKVRKAKRRWDKNNPQKKQAYVRSRRARISGSAGKFTSTDVQATYKSQSGQCYWCEKQLNGKYEIDHIIPIAKGGGNEANNICCACENCNRSKGAKMPHEWKGRLF